MSLPMFHYPVHNYRLYIEVGPDHAGILCKARSYSHRFQETYVF